MDTNRKIDFLKYSASFENSPTILCITETKLGKCIDDSEVMLPGYSIVRRDRDRRGGGIAIYYQSDVKVTEMLNLPISVEHCTVRITPTRGQPFILCCVYSPPSAKFDLPERLQSLLDALSDEKVPLILTGDFNRNLLTDRSFAENLRAEFHLTQLITEPTRITGSSATLLDHIYTSQKNLIAESGTVNMHVSDHNAVFCTLNNTHDVHRIKRLITYRLLRRVNQGALHVDLKQLPWSILDQFDDIDDITDTFNRLVLSVWDDHAPLKTKPAPKEKHNQPWMTYEIHNLTRQRDALYYKARYTKSENDWITYKTQRNKCTNAIRVAKRAFLADSSRGNSKTFWRQIKSSTGLGKQKLLIYRGLAALKL
jgi:hypothetical protein